MLDILPHMFKTIRLRNFRCFSSMDFDLTGPYDKPLTHVEVYGKNASGKTSLMESIRFLKKSALTFRSLSISQDIPDESGTDFGRELSEFMRSKRIYLESLVKANIMDGAEGPMELEYRFRVGDNDAVYRMVFSDNGAVIDESLKYVSVRGRTSEYYHVSSNDGKPKLKLNDDVFPIEGVRSALHRAVLQYWGKHTLMSLIMYEVENSNRDYMLETHPGITAITDYLQDLNSGTSGLGGDAVATLESDLGHGWINTGDRDLCDAYCAAVERFFTRIDRDVESVHYRYHELSPYHLEYTMVFDRYISGTIRHIPIYMESAGVRKLLSLLPMLFGCAGGKVSFVDEIDSGIHDKLMHDLFLQILPDMKGQLVVTTHNTSLIRDLDPHNVFMLDVDMDGDREVHSINSMSRTRASNNNSDRYIRGIFGAVPHISNVDMENIVMHLREDLE